MNTEIGTEVDIEQDCAVLSAKPPDQSQDTNPTDL